MPRPAFQLLEAAGLQDDGEESFFTPRNSDILFASDFDVNITFPFSPPPSCSLPLLRFSTGSSSCQDDENYTKTDLNYYHGEASLQRLCDGRFTKLRTLQTCCCGHGTVELHQDTDESMVVIKRVSVNHLHENGDRERDERTVKRFGLHRNLEDMLTEIGIYCYLSRQDDPCPYLLKMCDAFEVENDAWLVLQHAEGEDLFTIIKNTPSTSCDASRWTWQLLQAVSYLHGIGIGHRDISLENILMRCGNVQLMDFAQAVQTHSDCGVPLRYFCSLGKAYCRAPERKVPVETHVKIVAPREALPGQIALVATVHPTNYYCEVVLPHDVEPMRECLAEPCGYKVAPADMFACGVCMFAMVARMHPWREATLSDKHFAYVLSKGIKTLLRDWQVNPHPDILELLAELLQANPISRPTASECLSRAMFESMSDRSTESNASRL